MMSSDELNSARNTRSVQLRNNILLTGKQLSLAYVSTIQMFQGPAVVTMTIASTRMYRSLVDFTSGPPDACVILQLLFLSPVRVTAYHDRCHFSAQGNPQINGLRSMRIEQTHPTPIVLNPMKISAPPVFEQHPIS